MSIRLKRRLWSCAAGAVLAAGIVLAAGAAEGVASGVAREDEKAEAPAAPFTTFVGEIKGAPESARIAFVIEGDKFVAYVCSADEAFNNQFSRWFRGDVKE